MFDPSYSGSHQRVNHELQTKLIAATKKKFQNAPDRLGDSTLLFSTVHTLHAWLQVSRVRSLARY